MDQMVPAELAILKAQYAVESMAADVRLTEAGELLAKARTKVADFVDGIVTKVEQVEQVEQEKPPRCGIPAGTLPPCDLEWGHEGDRHSHAGDGFYARDYDYKHHERQQTKGGSKP